LKTSFSYDCRIVFPRVLDFVAFNFIYLQSFLFMKTGRTWPRDSVWSTVSEPISSSRSVLQKNIWRKTH